MDKATNSATPESEYYQHTGKLRLASWLSMRTRRRMFELFIECLRPGPQTSVLDVGVTCDVSSPESNYFERFYPYPKNITCVGTEDGAHLCDEYPGLAYIRIQAGEALPFPDAAFDIAFSNAVIEHVGAHTLQAAFLREVARVARSFFITTPNRWFPVEHHTGLPLLHYLPPRVFRAVLRGSRRYAFWANENNLNILSPRSLRTLLPRDCNPRVLRIRALGLTSNLAVVGTRSL